MRRLLLLSTVLVLAAALPASAKMPPFEMTVESRGDTIHVEVRIGRDDPMLVEGFDSLGFNCARTRPFPHRWKPTPDSNT